MNKLHILLIAVLSISVLQGAEKERISFFERYYRNLKKDVVLINKCYLTKYPRCSADERKQARSALARVTVQGIAFITSIAAISSIVIYGGMKRSKNRLKQKAQKEQELQERIQRERQAEELRIQHEQEEKSKQAEKKEEKKYERNLLTDTPGSVAWGLMTEPDPLEIRLNGKLEWLADSLLTVVHPAFKDSTLFIRDTMSSDFHEKREVVALNLNYLEQQISDTNKEWQAHKQVPLKKNDGTVVQTYNVHEFIDELADRFNLIRNKLNKWILNPSLTKPDSSQVD